MSKEKQMANVAQSRAKKPDVERLHDCTPDQGDIPPSPPSLTLKEYAAAMRIPLDFLEHLGLSTIHVNSKPVVRLVYYDENRLEVGARYPLILNGPDSRFRWRKGSKILPYGLWKLNEAREAGYIVLIEGESNTQTLWYHSVPALGIPGAATWKSAWTRYLEGINDIYVWRNPDSSGTEFVERVGKTLPEVQILTTQEGCEDISKYHIQDNDVPSLVQELIANATPYQAILDAARSEAAAKAERVAAALLSRSDILSEFVELCRQQGLVGENRNAKLLYLTMVSRLTNRPTSVVVKGPSSGGKSYLVGTVLEAFPPSAFYELSSMSERALAYSQESLQHRMLVVTEASGLASEFGAYLVRTLLSEGRIRYETVEKTQNGLQDRLIEREGPTGLIITTTWTNLHSENETRMLSLTVRDDPKQTKAIMRALAQRANGRRPVQPDLTPWHALQEWLELAGLREVTIPYAHKLAELANPTAVRLRRDFGAVLNLICAHAILHQRGRECEDGRIVATLDDYRAVHTLASDLISDGVKATVKEEVRETVEAVQQLCQANHDEPVKVMQVAKRLCLDDSAASRRVRVATKLGYIVNLEDKKGRPAKLVLGDPMPDEVPVLPDPDALEGGEGGYPSVRRAIVQSLEESAALTGDDIDAIFRKVLEL
jgi:hypothetical protein